MMGKQLKEGCTYRFSVFSEAKDRGFAGIKDTNSVILTNRHLDILYFSFYNENGSKEDNETYLLEGCKRCAFPSPYPL